MLTAVQPHDWQLIAESHADATYPLDVDRRDTAKFLQPADPIALTARCQAYRRDRTPRNQNELTALDDTFD